MDYSNLNGEQFVRELDSEAGRVKVAEAQGLFIAEKLRERGFARLILQPHAITVQDLQRDENSDQLYFLDEKEVAVAPAVSISFKGAPDGEYIFAKKYRINLQLISSALFQKNEYELLAYTQPITRLVEENSVREMEAIEDVTLLRYADAAATTSGNAIAVPTGTGGSITKQAIILGISQLAGKQLVAQTLLMDLITYQGFNLMGLMDMGSDLLKDVFVDGYKYKTFLGYKLIVSIKTALFDHPTTTLADGRKAKMIYIFAEEKAVGRFITFDTPKFGAYRKFSMIEMQGWEFIGMGIGNANGVARVTLLD